MRGMGTSKVGGGRGQGIISLVLPVPSVTVSSAVTLTTLYPTLPQTEFTKHCCSLSLESQRMVLGSSTALSCFLSPSQISVKTFTMIYLLM